MSGINSFNLRFRNIEARKNNKLATRYDRAAAIYNLLLNAVRRLSSNAKTKPQTKADTWQTRTHTTKGPNTHQPFTTPAPSRGVITYVQ